MIQTEREVREPEYARDLAIPGNTLVSKADLMDALPWVIMATVTGPFGGSFLARHIDIASGSIPFRCGAYTPLK